MSIKSLVAFIAIFIVQLITSCTCDDSVTYEIEYEGITVTPLDTSGFLETELSEMAYRNAFGLVIDSDFTPRKTALNQMSFGFTQAMATSCPDDEYIYVDPIDYAEILVTDVETNEQVDVSSLFGTYDAFGTELISLSEFFEIKEDWQDGFRFELVDYESIPGASIFTVHVYLQSGIRLSAQTQQINFYD